MDYLPAAFEGLSNYPQFILVAIIQEPDGLKKYPVDRHTLLRCDANDPRNQADFFTIRDALLELEDTRETQYCVGFVLTHKDPFFLLDVDKAYDIVTQKWSELAVELRSLFVSAALEVSSSHIGLHFIGSLSESITHRCRGKVGTRLEFYTQKRFIALTGYHAQGDVNTICDSAVKTLLNKYFDAPAPVVSHELWTDVPRVEWKGYEKDDDLINAALSQKSVRAAFGHSASFRDLWYRNADALREFFPSSKSAAFDESGADMSLAIHLAFFTGANCTRMHRLMLRSHLIRDKWIQRPDYLRDTILKACAKQTTVMTLHKPLVATNNPLPERQEQQLIEIPQHELAPMEISGSALLPAYSQPEYFKGCVYISRTHEIWTPDGLILKPEQFKVHYGGRQFVLDQMGEKTTWDAWRVFTQSQVFKFPKVFRSAFFPHKKPGDIFEFDGRLVVNTWYPLKTRCVAGDPSPFLNHIAKLLPDETDQIILLSYLAACVQYPGTKFRWCPLIQGMEGNGKTLISKCVAEVIGFNFVWSPRAKSIASRFNSWMRGRLFAWVDEVLIDDTDTEAIELLKVMLSENRMELEPKGVDCFYEEVCVNFVLNTNHKHAIRKTKNERRFAIFFTAQQNFEDLEKSGLTPQYFLNFARWLEKDGYAIIHHYLINYKIPDEYNPATLCVRAPITSTTHEAINSTQAAHEIVVQDAIADELPGFRAGFISAHALEKLITENFLHKVLPRRTRRAFLERLGYLPHPLLASTNDRTPRAVMPDGARTVLYVHKKSKALEIKDLEQLLAYYTSTQ